MQYVQTVLGDVLIEDVGFTLMHEHLVNSAAGIPENYPELYIEGYYEIALNSLIEMKDNGINTVVEATTYDLGRDVKTLARLSQESGVNIIACTGRLMRLPGIVGHYTPEQFAQSFIKDLTKGIADTGIKAGILKAGMDMEGPTPDIEFMHRAVAIASNETQFPIMLHSYPLWEIGRHQLRIMKEENVNLERIKVDHCLETTDIDYIAWLVDQGCWLGIDRLPNIPLKGRYLVATGTRIKFIKKLIDAGFSDRMLFSHDIFPATTFFDNPMRTKEDRSKDNPDGFLFLKNVVFRKLSEMGIDENKLERICIENPKRFFEGKN